MGKILFSLVTSKVPDSIPGPDSSPAAGRERKQAAPVPGGPTGGPDPASGLRQGRVLLRDVAVLKFLQLHDSWCWSQARLV